MYTLQLTNSYKDEVNKGIWNGTETFTTMRLVIKLRSVEWRLEVMAQKHGKTHPIRYVQKCRKEENREICSY